MGFKDSWDRQMARSKAASKERALGVAPRYNLLNYVMGGIYHGVGVEEPIAGARAEYEAGAKTGRTTLTRLAAGAVIAGPIGFLVGGMIQKDASRGYVTITFANGKVVVFDDAVAEEKRMRTFVTQINAASAHYAAELT